MRTFTWWIHNPLIKGSGNPTDEDLPRFRAQGFSSAVSLLEENKQPPRYDRASAQAEGWTIYCKVVPTASPTESPSKQSRKRSFSSMR